jgi:hypothetical protein
MNNSRENAITATAKRAGTRAYPDRGYPQVRAMRMRRP